jgi:diguanylate cyclase (GGDEF)-like protein
VYDAFLCLTAGSHLGLATILTLPVLSAIILLVKKGLYIMKTAPSNFEQKNLLYDLYQSLPIGVVFLDSHMKVLSANRQFRKYFPFYVEGPYGLLLCSAIRCQQDMADRPYDKAGVCQNCSLVKGIQQMIRDNIPMEMLNWNCHLFCQGHQAVKYFQVSGVPVSDACEKYAALFFEDITSRMQKENSLKEKMKLDLPTMVLNKYSLIQFLITLLSDNHKMKFTLCMIDLDNFKGINDQYGHLSGDKVLQTFSKVARRNIRTGDVIGRYGGDEFLFIFHNIGSQQAAGIISRIQKELQETCRNILSVPVSFSAGIVSFKRGNHSEMQWKNLIEEVDRMLYQAKAKGKNQIAMGNHEKAKAAF